MQKQQFHLSYGRIYFECCPYLLSNFLNLGNIINSLVLHFNQSQQTLRQKQQFKFMSTSNHFHQGIKYQMASKSSFACNQDVPSFILKTYSILENHSYADIICWTKNGEGFIVKNIKQFSQQVLPKYFRHGNYTSFVRQLNMYDFHKTRMENHENCFKNPIFQRDAKHLLKEVKRKDYKLNKILKQQNQTQKEVQAQQSLQNNRNLQNRVNPLGKQIGNAFLEAPTIFYKEWMQSLGKLESMFEGKIEALGNACVSKDSDLVECLETLYKSKRVNNAMMYIMNQFEKSWTAQLSRQQCEKKSVQSNFNTGNQESKKCQQFVLKNLQKFKPLQKKTLLNSSLRGFQTVHSLKSITNL